MKIVTRKGNVVKVRVTCLCNRQGFGKLGICSTRMVKARAFLGNPVKSMERY